MTLTIQEKERLKPIIKRGLIDIKLYGLENKSKDTILNKKIKVAKLVTNKFLLEGNN